MFGSLWSGVQREAVVKYPFVHFRGAIPNAELPYFYRGAKLYVSTDVLAACPNSVIEALAVGRRTRIHAGVLPEMVARTAGRCVQPVGNPWQCETLGNLNGLCEAALEVCDNWSHFHRNARGLAEERYSLDRMVNAYWGILLNEKLRPASS